MKPSAASPGTSCSAGKGVCKISPFKQKPQALFQEHHRIVYAMPSGRGGGAENLAEGGTAGDGAATRGGGQQT